MIGYGCRVEHTATCAVKSPGTHYLCIMRVLLTFLMVFSMIGVVGVLGAGIVGFLRGGGNPQRSNQLMRWRVMLQALAILIFVLLLTLFKR